MSDTSLFEAVERFAVCVHAVSDADLERAWAWQAYDDGVRYAFFRTYEELRELAVRAVAERAGMGAALSQAQHALAQYHAAYRDLQAILIGLPDAELDREPAPGEWPLRTVVEHIVEADGGFYGVISYALERQRGGGDRPAEIPKEYRAALFGPADEAAFKAAMAGTLAEIDAYYAALHQRILDAFAGITDEESEAPSRYWEGYGLPIRFRLHRFDSHLRQHTIQAEKTLDALGRPPSEARRLVRLIYAALAEAEGATIGAPGAGAEQRRSVAAAIAKRAEEIRAIVGEKR